MARRTTPKKCLYRRDYATVGELLADARRDPLAHWRATAANEDQPREWNGRTDKAQALAMAENGWQDGWREVEVIRSLLAGKIAPAMHGARMVTQWDVAGDEPDIGRYLAGEPENMIEYVQEAAPAAGGQFVDIEIGWGVSASIEPDTIRRRGAAVLALVDLLESAGRRCSILLSHGLMVGNGNYSVLTCPLKGHGEALDRDRLAFLLVHPAGLRQVGFAAAFATLPKSLYCDVLGCSMPAYRANPAAGVHLPSMLSEDGAENRHFESHAATAEWLRGVLTSQGVAVDP